LHAPERPNRYPRRVFQLIQRVPSRSRPGSNFDRCADPAWLECNGQTKMYSDGRALEACASGTNKSSHSILTTAHV
jgi:hypothetical protein